MRVRQVDIPFSNKNTISYYYCLFYSEDDLKQFEAQYPWFKSSEFIDSINFNTVIIIQRDLNLEGEQIEILTPQYFRREVSCLIQNYSIALNSLNTFDV